MKHGVEEFTNHPSIFQDEFLRGLASKDKQKVVG
jgi:hypothetical protein